MGDAHTLAAVLREKTSDRAEREQWMYSMVVEVGVIDAVADGQLLSL